MTQPLNPSQQQVVETTKGPVLVIAGPGSGKTKTLVERVVYLLSSGVNPSSILVATFTEKAAKELMTRISNRLIEEKIKVNPNDLYLGTLHSIFLRFIEENLKFSNVRRNYKLIEPFEQTYFVYNHINEFRKIDDIDTIINPSNKKFVNNWSAAQILVSKINVLSEEAVDVCRLKASDDVSIVALAHAYEDYQNLIQEENILDFSTIQAEMLMLIQRNPGVLEDIQNKIEYFMIDEYQDTNTIQEKILLLLASKNNNICVVGDDDQGLYRFRGATIRNILQFQSNFKPRECKKFILNTNYRSHPGIIEFYNNYMQSQEWTRDGIEYRFSKSIVPCEREFPKTASVVKLSVERPICPSNQDTDSFTDAENYHREVLNFINYLCDNNIISNLNQITFLYRSVRTAEATELMRFLENNGIQVFSPRSNLFFERPEIKMIIGALLSVFPQCLETTEIVKDEIKDRTYRPYYDYFLSEVKKNPVENRQLIAWVMKHAAEHFDLKSNTDYSFSGLIYELFKFPLFANLLEVDLRGKKSDLRPAYNIAIFINIITKFEYIYNLSVLTPKSLKKDLRHLFNQYLRFVIDGGLSEFEDFDETVPSGCISFMTIHQSKGLEFPITIVGSMNAFPRNSHDALDKLLQSQYYGREPFEPFDEIKNYDFYRLFYTAFSRAKNLLVLTGNEHGGQGALPSKYLRPYWNSIPSWRDESQFEPKLLEIAAVQEANIKHEYAFTSHILLYENCPLQYKFFKELGFPVVRAGSTLGGSLLHETIEDIHRAVLRGEADTLSDENIRTWFRNNYQLLAKAEHSFLSIAQRDSILKQILRYRDANSSSWHLIHDAEFDVSLVRDDYILKGTIDLIKSDNGTIDIVDFKSGDKPDVNTTDPIKRKILTQYRRQLEVYAFIVEQKTGMKINKLHLYYPKEESGNPKISFPYQADGVESTIQTFEKIVKKIEKKDFSMDGHHCQERLCRECDFRHYCHKM